MDNETKELLTDLIGSLGKLEEKHEPYNVSFMVIDGSTTYDNLQHDCHYRLKHKRADVVFVYNKDNDTLWMSRLKNNTVFFGPLGPPEIVERLLKGFTITEC